MIDLTPLDVRKKKGDFSRALRGYETAMVDEFLELAAERMEELVRENASLRERGVWSAAFTDSILSPLAARADVMFVLSADSVGPFDSHVGTLALLNLIGAEVAGALRSSARDRLAAVEEAWSRHGSLTESS